MSEEKQKPAADEQTLAKLLEAAFVLQEHNRQMELLRSPLGGKREPVEPESPVCTLQNEASQGQPSNSMQVTSPMPSGDDASTLGEIVETQYQIQVRRFDFEGALQLVADRVCEMTRATGAAIGILEGTSVRYWAVAGRGEPAECVVPLERSMFAPCLETASALRCADACTDSRLDAGECRRRGIQSLIAVPVFHDGGIAGGLELYHTSPNAFTEQDIHTCQLMAGLVGEALAREQETSKKKSLANERTAMLEALEELRPHLAALAGAPGAPAISSAAPVGATAPSYSSCRKCGHRLMPEEQFCGQCGSPCAGDRAPSNIQSKVASLWYMQEAQKKAASVESTTTSITKGEKVDRPRPETSRVRFVQQHAPEPFTSEDLEFGHDKEISASVPPEVRQLMDIDNEPLTQRGESVSIEPTENSEALIQSEAPQGEVWSSAASTRAFLEQVASGEPAGGLLKFWTKHRGDIYLGLAVILVLCVLRWGIWSDPPANVTAAPAKGSASQRKPTQDPGLSTFDRMLIQLGLAEAPEPQPDKGNPAVQVWVDLQTALYYCPGATQYGKTTKGKFTTQREAELDQFEPASRKACN